MLRTLKLADPRRGLLIAGGVALGIALAGAMASISWETGAIGLGFALAVLAGLAQRCSA